MTSVGRDTFATLGTGPDDATATRTSTASRDYADDVRDQAIARCSPRPRRGCHDPLMTSTIGPDHVKVVRIGPSGDPPVQQIPRGSTKLPRNVIADRWHPVCRPLPTGDSAQHDGAEVADGEASPSARRRSPPGTPSAT